MDSYRHKGLRKRLIDSLRNKGIDQENVLEAMMKVPRHLFLDKAFEEWAYKDQAFPISSGQTISQPYTVAFQTLLIDPQPSDIVLEIGTGSGYQASVLSHLCRKIYSIERHKSLCDKTSARLKSIGYGSIRTLYGDGYVGASKFAPFDKILITAGATSIPKTLIDQLAPEGMMVVPVALSDDKVMTRITKQRDGSLTTEEFGHFRFVPFLQGVSE